jgi:branched-chain amino acid transport system permease protein
LLVVGFLLPGLLGGSNRIFSTFVLIAIFSMMAYGLDIVLSYLGEVSLGHTLFWAAGAYATAYLSVKAGVAPLPALAISLLVAVVLAVVLGVATIRTREFVFSLVTYGAAFIGLTIVANSSLLGGSDGIVGIPVLTIPAVGGQYTASSNADLWPIAFVLLVLVIALVGRFRRSRLGATALMTQMNPDLAITLGVDIRRVRVLVFVLSAPVTAVAGWLYAYQRSYVSPDLFSPYFLLFMLTAVILPGRRLLLGPLVGAAILTVQQELFSFGGDADKIVLGGILATVLLLSPDGLVGIGRMIMRRSRRPRRTAGGEGPGGQPSPGTELPEQAGATAAGDQSPASGERPASRGRGATQRLARTSYPDAMPAARMRRRGAP